ncbi:hypothetical protein QQP08_026081 [Theobroma cacao]|nr:hypothetical protein QQP08_026081 [Theobroma cacao]
MAYLRSLRISSINEDEFLQLKSLSSPPSLLQNLRLHGRLSTLHDWIFNLENLVRVGLQWTRISYHSYKILGALPKLLYPYLYKGYDGGPDRWKVKHIPNVELYCRSRGARYDRYKLSDSRLSNALL